jgi:hypothetical protein
LVKMPHEVVDVLLGEWKREETKCTFFCEYNISPLLCCPIFTGLTPSKSHLAM